MVVLQLVKMVVMEPVIDVQDNVWKNVVELVHIAVVKHVKLIVPHIVKLIVPGPVLNYVVEFVEFNALRHVV